MSDSKYLASVKQQFLSYKSLGEKSIAQLEPGMLFIRPNEESNSIAMIIQHMHGNMLSRWTDFLTSDGEKKWRDRDGEFESEEFSRETLKTLWNDGWNCLFRILNGLTPEDLSKIILIRNEEHTVMEAINRQLTHYASHIGQIIFISKMILDRDWNTISIPRKASREFNAKKGL